MLDLLRPKGDVRLAVEELAVVELTAPGDAILICVRPVAVHSVAKTREVVTAWVSASQVTLIAFAPLPRTSPPSNRQCSWSRPSTDTCQCHRSDCS